jgi:hypothetical protein
MRRWDNRTQKEIRKMRKLYSENLKENRNPGGPKCKWNGLKLVLLNSVTECQGVA